MSRTRLLATALCALLLIPTAASAGPSDRSNGNRVERDTLTQACEEGTVIYEGVTEIWPPNHKPHFGALTLDVTDDSQQYGYDIYAYHDQVLENFAEMNGAGNTPLEEDITLTPQEGQAEDTTAEFEAGQNHYMGTTAGDRSYDVRVISERSGQEQDGRTYTIAGTVDFGDDDQNADGDCDFSFNIWVPHDQRHNGGKKGLATGLFGF